MCVFVFVCMCVCVCDWIYKKGLIRAIINTEISRFEILITVYLENA